MKLKLNKKNIFNKKINIAFIVVFFLLISISGLMLVEGGSQLETTLKITKLTIGGDDTFDFTVTGTTSYDLSITTGSGSYTYLDTTIYDTQQVADFLTKTTTITAGQIMTFPSPQTIVQVTLPNVITNMAADTEGQVFGVIYSGVIDGSSSFNILGISQVFEAPWDNDGCGGTAWESEHDVCFIFDPPVTVSGSDIFIGFVSTADQVGDFKPQVSPSDIGGSEGICIEQDDAVDNEFHTDNKCTVYPVGDFLMKIESVNVSGMGISDPTSIDPGTYSITELEQPGWTLITASCNDGFSVFDEDTVSGIEVGEGDNIECIFENVSLSNTDTDGDGIYDDVDTLPNIHSSDFSDIELGGTSIGTITSNSQQILTVTEAPNPDGVNIVADISGGLEPASITVCGGLSKISVSPGDNILVTCGSITIDVISGTIEAIFISSGGTQATTSIDSGNSITFDQDDFSFVAPTTNTQTILIDVEGPLFSLEPDSTISLGFLKVIKQTTGGDDTFDFAVTGPTSYNPSINTVGSENTIFFDSLNVGDTDYPLSNLNIPLIDIGLLIPFNGESISKITYTISGGGLVTSSTGTLKAVIYTDIDPNELPTGGDNSFTLVSSRTFQDPWVDDLGNPINNPNYHDVVAIFDPPVTLTGYTFVGIETEDVDESPFIFIVSGGEAGLDPQKLCVEKQSPDQSAFTDCNYEIAMKIEVSGGSGGNGIGVNGPTPVISGTYSIQESIPSGWTLTSTSCNDSSSSFNVDTVVGLEIGGGEYIECTFENEFGVSNPDTDGDGIHNDVDTLPETPSDDFSDVGLDGTSFGIITSRGEQILTVTEAQNPNGVRIEADISGGLIPASIAACGGLSIITVGAGDNIVVTCSSVTIDVTNGPVEATFISSGGTQATTSLDSGNSITFNQDDFSFATPTTNTQTIIIDVEGTPITIIPGDTSSSRPEVGTINTSLVPVQLGTLVSASAAFTDLGALEIHTAEFDWGDQTTSAGEVSENGLSGTVTGSHTYSTPGVYVVTLTVTDDSGDSGTSIFQFIIIYDTTGGFVTGGGWINSPIGVYVPNSSLVGKATFGFVSKYQNDATIPTGNTQFSFQVADLKFKSTSYDWLVVAGSNVKFKGTGTINGQGNYGFQLFGFDADINTNDSHHDDKFRIKIWDKNNGDVVVYDNNLGESENAEPLTILGGGSIAIHKP